MTQEWDSDVATRTMINEVNKGTTNTNLLDPVRKERDPSNHHCSHAQATNETPRRHITKANPEEREEKGGTENMARRNEREVERQGASRTGT